MAHCNAAGLALIEKFEGERLRAYPDPGTGGDPWTIGFGHIVNVHPGQTCTHEQARAWLAQDVGRSEAEVSRLVSVNLNPNQFSALVSFQYNTGGLAGSGLLAAVNADPRGRNAIAIQFVRWVHAGGVILPGLVARRGAETALYFTP